MKAAIIAIEYYLPETVLDNVRLAEEFPEWTATDIENKLGIRERRIVAKDECSSDLGVAAARKLLQSGACGAESIDYLLFCTQSPDYFLPTTACLMQTQLGIPTTAGALDFNLGCSGFIYGLGLAKGLIETGQARSVLLVTGETYSKFIHPGDKSVKTLFGDGASATLIRAKEDESDDLIGPFVFGTDGAGANNLIVPAGGMRQPTVFDPQVTVDENGNRRTVNNLYMNGPEIFSFSLRVVPNAVSELLAKAGKRLDEVDLFVFHQANQYMLEHLRKKLKIPIDKFSIALASCGNTVSSTVPIALKQAWLDGKLKKGHLVMLVGFGVGYSWGATLVRWSA
jgi:3-oxoacyl-[acyl-carrier-protein] synthase III